MPQFILVSHRLDTNQRHELAKTLFGLGNMCFSSLILGSVVLGNFEPGLFTIGAFIFVTLLLVGIILSRKEGGK
jgi:hypothetical protein